MGSREREMQKKMEEVVYMLYTRRNAEVLGHVENVGHKITWGNGLDFPWLTR